MFGRAGSVANYPSGFCRQRWLHAQGRSWSLRICPTPSLQLFGWHQRCGVPVRSRSEMATDGDRGRLIRALLIHVTYSSSNWYLRVCPL